MSGVVYRKGDAKNSCTKLPRSDSQPCGFLHTFSLLRRSGFQTLTALKLPQVARPRTRKRRAQCTDSRVRGKGRGGVIDCVATWCEIADNLLSVRENRTRQVHDRQHQYWARYLRRKAPESEHLSFLSVHARHTRAPLKAMAGTKMSFIAAAASVASLLIGGASAFVVPSQVGARTCAFVGSHDCSNTGMLDFSSGVESITPDSFIRCIL